MKRILLILLPLTLLSAQPLRGDECLEAAVDEMNDLYSVGCGCEDGIYNAVSSSMFAWGVGLFAGIALLTGLVHQSKGSAAHAHADSNSN
ncbi:MAG: hypothetical protein KR126chlam1_00633 [Chlamydiae bacterium]|nr:hypothetical protein [Chlamydiota bacterium]